MSGRRAASKIAASVLALALGACGVPLEDEPQGVPAGEVPEGLRPVDSVAPPVTAATEPVTVWFVREGELVPVEHRVERPAGPTAAVTELLAGPSAGEQQRALRSAIPDPAAVVEVVVAGGIATVALTPAFSEIPSADQVLAVGQLVLTLTDLRGVGLVRFLIDDVDIAVPLPSGEAADRPVSRDDYFELTLSG